MLTGGCHCGAVRYEVLGEPVDCTICHCEDCRRACGAPCVGWLSVKAEGLRIVTGQPASRASSPGVSRTFCPDCGTQLTYRRTDLPDDLDVTTCSLDDPASVEPRAHTFTARRMPWLKLDDGLPRFPGWGGGPPEG